jgi:sulfate permease
MMSPLYSFLLVPMIVGMFLAVNMGASGTVPSFSAAYGANIIKRFAIPGVFGIFVLIGALVAGKKVGITMGKDIMPAEMLTPEIITIVMLSVGLSLLAANFLAVPQSTSQSTVFAMAGPAVYYSNLNTHKLLFEIIPAWFILPVIGFLIMLAIGKLIYPKIKNHPGINYESLSSHPILKILVLLSSCYVAFAIGSNNVANASGPMASMIINELGISSESDANFVLIMILTVLIMAPCFAVGSSLFGNRLLRSTGKEIVEFGPVGATAIAVTTATLLLLASVVKGIPTSLVQLNTFAIVAVGVSKMGWKKIILHRTVQKFWIVWIIAPAFSFVLSFFLTYLLDRLDFYLF